MEESLLLATVSKPPWNLQLFKYSNSDYNWLIGCGHCSFDSFLSSSFNFLVKVCQANRVTNLFQLIWAKYGKLNNEYNLFPAWRLKMYQWYFSVQTGCFSDSYCLHFFFTLLRVYKCTLLSNLHSNAVQCVDVTCGAIRCIVEKWRMHAFFFF